MPSPTDLGGWSVEALGGGTQNFMVRVRRDGDGIVVRRPTVADTALREGRVLLALASTNVPHARLIAAGDDFLVTEEVLGYNPTVSMPEAYRSPELAFAMVDALAPVGAVMVEGLGRPDGWLERQVKRWRSQLGSYEAIDGLSGARLPRIDDVGVWLDAHRPKSCCPGLIHGDYHFANVIIDPDRPVVAAIVDWELATIGDPLLDLAHFLVTSACLDVAPVPMPSTAQLVDRFAQSTNRDVTDHEWYQVLAAYRLGVLLEGTFARANAGLAPRETGDELHERAVALLEHGMTLIS